MLALGKELTVEQRLSKATVDIMANKKYVALAGILMIGDVSVVEDVPNPGIGHCNNCWWCQERKWAFNI